MEATMIGYIAKLIKSARSKNSDNPTGRELLQTNHTANRSSASNSLEWQPLDVSKLNITTDKVQQIEASMVKNARQEFAAVMKELNSSQSARKTNNN
jgi:hypothetical protein